MTTATLAAIVLIGGFIALMLMRVPVSFAMLLSTLGCALVTGTNLSVLVRQMVDGVNNFSLLSIPFFILMGEIMGAGGISDKIIDLANLAVGRFHGGLAYVNCLSSMFFGGISGSAVADVSSLGSVVIPMMVKQGYTEDFSVGLTVTTACQGVLIPPSILMILYGVIADQSISELFLAALLPGLFVGFFLMLATYVICRFYGIEGTGEAFNWRLMVQKLWWAKLSLMVPVIILGGIYAGVFTATESAVIAAFYGIFISMFVYREMDWKQLRNAVYSSAKMTGKLGILWGVSVAFGEVMTMYQIPTMLSGYLLGITSDPTCILLIISAFLIFTGCFMNSMSQVIIFTPIYLPIIMAAGINPIHFCMVFVVNAEIGFLTPPLGTTLFVAMEQAGVSLGEVSKAVLPFIGAYLLSTLVIILFPWLSLVLPKTFM